MAKRGPSKSEMILHQSHQKVFEAKERRDDLCRQMDVAQAVYEALVLADDALKQGLAKTPRKVNAPKSTASAAGKRSRTASIETGKGNAGTVDLLPDNPEEFQHGATA